MNELEKRYANRANLAAVDHLGRALPSADEVGEKKPEKVVALFYYLWLADITEHKGPMTSRRYSKPIQTL